MTQEREQKKRLDESRRSALRDSFVVWVLTFIAIAAFGVLVLGQFYLMYSGLCVPIFVAGLVILVVLAIIPTIKSWKPRS